MNRVSTLSFAAISCILILVSAGPARGANQRPVSFGTTLPSTCFTGDLFFKTNAPQGSNVYACVAGTWYVQGLSTLGGDVTGLPTAATVTQIQGRPVAPTVPASGQSLTWNSSTNRWEPQTASSGATTLSGDVVGPSGTNTVTQIQGRPVASTVPGGGQSLTWNSSTNRWEPQTVSSGSTTLSGDVVGPSGTNTVTQIQGRPVASTAPGSGQSLAWNNSTNRWEPQTISGGSTTLAGDVVGPAGSNTVTQLQGRPVLSTAPTTGQALVWNGGTARWEPQTITTGGGSGSGASMASQLGDLTVIQASGTVLTIGPNCAFTTPCNVRFGAQIYTLTSPVTVTLSSGTGNAYVYLASTGTLTVGHGLVLSCSNTCASPPGVTAFPTDSVPLFLWHATNGSWDSSGTDSRAFLSSKDVIPGTGLVSTEMSGHTTIGADPSVISLRTAVPGTSSAACSAGAWATDATFYYLCVSQNSWRRASLSTF